MFDIGLSHLKDNPIFKNTIPSKIFEMMSAGLPILLVSPEGEASGIIEKHNVGRWVKSGNSELLAHEIKNIFLSKDDLMQYSSNSLKNSYLYQREVQAKKVSQTIKQLLNKN